MRIGLLSEGPIDFELISALLRRISRSRVGITWPLRVADMIVELRYRPRGYGQVVNALRRLLPLLDSTEWLSFSLFVVVIDNSSRARRDIRKLLGGQQKFVLGVAIREIEAWWLADRRNTLEWLGLHDVAHDGFRYWAHRYSPERDTQPKDTLDELTRLSERVDRTYGDGNLELAREFAAAGSENAELDQIENGCRRGFAPFCQDSIEALRRAQRRGPTGSPVRARRQRAPRGL